MTIWYIFWPFGVFMAIWYIFGHFIHFMTIWYIFWPFGVFMAIWYICSRSGILDQKTLAASNLVPDLPPDPLQVLLLLSGERVVRRQLDVLALADPPLLLRQDQPRVLAVPVRLDRPGTDFTKISGKTFFW
jgi:hypothetical protein